MRILDAVSSSTGRLLGVLVPDSNGHTVASRLGDPRAFTGGFSSQPADSLLFKEGSACALTTTLSTVNLSNEEFSVWLRMRVITSNPSVSTYFFSLIKDSNNRIYADIDTNGNIRFVAINGGVSATTSVSNFVSTYAGKLIDIVFVRKAFSGNAATFEVYIDGVQVASASNAQAGVIFNTSSTFNVANYSAGYTSYMERVYRATLWNRALDSSEMESLITYGVSVADQWGVPALIDGSTLNGGFETAGAGGANTLGSWSESLSGTATITQDASGYSGYCARLYRTASGDTCTLQQSITCTLGKRYRLKFWGKTTTSGTVSTGHGSVTGNLVVNQALTGNWVRYSADWIATSGSASNFQVYFVAGTTGELLIDELSVQQIGAVVDFDFTVASTSIVPDRSSNALHGTLSSTNVSFPDSPGSFLLNTLNVAQTKLGSLTAGGFFTTGASGAYTINRQDNNAAAWKWQAANGILTLVDVANSNASYLFFNSAGSWSFTTPSTGNVFSGASGASQSVYLGTVVMGRSSTGYPLIGHGFAVTSSANTYNYLVSDTAAAIDFASGGIKTYHAASGTAGQPITWTTRLNIPRTGTATLDSGTIWHSGNDGASSGLDADLLDGLQGSSFAQLASASHFTAKFGGQSVLYWDAWARSSGTYGQGSIGSWYHHTAGYLAFDRYDNWAVTGSQSGTYRLNIPSSGTVTALDTSATAQIKSGNLTVSNIIPTGILAAADGSSSAPSISFNADTDTGLFRPTSNILGGAAGGVEVFRVHSNGNVAIGTASVPAMRLQLQATTAGGDGLFARNSDTGSTSYGYLSVSSAVGSFEMRAHSAAHSAWPNTALLVSSSAFTGGMAIYAGGNASLQLGTNSSTRMTIAGDGKVGIGVTPTQSFDVLGTTRLGGDLWLYNSAGPSNRKHFKFAHASDGTTRFMTLQDDLATPYQTWFTFYPGAGMDVGGSMTVTGGVTVSTQFTSTVATGTAPFVVSSTTTVANLSASYLNGNTGSYFVARSNHTGTQAFSTITGTVPVDQGGTGLTSYTSGDILYATGSTTLSKLAKPASGQIGVITLRGDTDVMAWTTATASGSKLLYFSGNTPIVSGSPGGFAIFGAGVFVAESFFRFKVSSTAPSGPESGDSYINSSDNTLRVYLGGAWKSVALT